MYYTHNTLSEIVRAKSTSLLNRHLAAMIDLHSQVKQAHWNVRGANFIAVHELFDRVASEVEAYSDLIAERARALGATAEGTVRSAASQSFLPPYALGVADGKEHLFAVAGALAGFEQSAREAIDEAAAAGDQETSDVFTQIGRGLAQQLWLVESHLPSPNILFRMDAAPPTTRKQIRFCRFTFATNRAARHRLKRFRSASNKA